MTASLRGSHLFQYDQVLVFRKPANNAAYPEVF